MYSVDTVAPQTPLLTVVPSGTGVVTLSWVSSDAVSGVAFYDVFMDGNLLGSVGPVSTYPVSGLLAGSTHAFQVRAHDVASNLSALSNSAAVTTTLALATTTSPIRVASLSVTAVTLRRAWQVRATVKITNLSNQPVSKVRVTGMWSGAATGSSSSLTNASGVAVLTSPKFAPGGAATFTVTDATKTGYTYDPASNLVPGLTTP